MERQMALLESDNETTEAEPRRRPAPRRVAGRWQLDDRTREVGKRGVAAARQALATAATRRPAA